MKKLFHFIQILFLSFFITLLFVSCNFSSSQPEIVSIYVSQLPTKMNYAYEEPLDLSGLVVNAKYSDGSEKEVDDWTSMPKPWTKLKSSGAVSVTITYEEKITNFSVVVASEGEEVFQPEESKEGSIENPINLTVNKWTDGNIIHPDSDGTGEQWFKFVASASTERIYIKLGTMTYSNTYLYDESFNQIGKTLNVQKHYDISEIYRSYSLKNGRTYYIKVSGAYYNDEYYTGNYKIGVTDFPAQPETVITELNSDTWTNGNIIHPDSDGTGEQWFKFVASASTERIYIKLGTMTYLNAYLYDSSLYSVGNGFNVQGDSGRIGVYGSYSLTIGETYYIQVSGEYYDRVYSGTYKIGVTNLPMQPETVITELNSDTWTNGKIIHPNSNGTGKQWFSFTSSNSIQHILIELDSITYLNAYLYDSNFNQIGKGFNVQGSGKIGSCSYSLYSGTVYYILVSGEYYDRFYSGKYKIAVNDTGNIPE